jgi:glycerophosphoryl diester phosphodiesterase/acylphosphatase
MQIIIYIFLGLLLLYLIAVRPDNSRRERMEIFSRTFIAHRGLHNRAKGIPENSLPAFQAAIEKGYAIELDIRESADEQLVVFHDANLKRMTGVDRYVRDLSVRELKELSLLGTEERIPTFDEVLDLVKGQVPLVVEIKCEDRRIINRLCERASCFLDGYDGLYCIESFHPQVLRWYRKKHAQILRGQLSEKFRGYRFPKTMGTTILSLCLLNFYTRPDFIAYNHHQADLLRYQILRWLGCYGAAWTIRSPGELKKAAASFDAMIFEGFDPGTPGITDDRKKANPGAKRKTAAMVRKHLIVRGTVQGVGFRYRATYIAQDLGITGWVRNLFDGAVEMELQGLPDRLDEMLERLKAQPFIEMDHIEEERIPLAEHEFEFKVRY